LSDQEKLSDQETQEHLMDDIPDLYMIEDLEQMRTVADDLRRRIVDSLAARAMTVTQLGDLLGVAPAKTHYHVRELERVGLVKLVETREKGGVLEKYYRTVAKVLAVSPDVLKMIPPDESVALIEGVMRSQTASYLEAVRRTTRAKSWEEDIIIFSTGSLWMTNDEWRQAAQRIEALLLPYRVARNVPGEREIAIALMAHHLENLTADGAERAVEDLEPVAPVAPEARRPDAAAMKPKRLRFFAAGSATLHAADLETAITRGGMLDIFVLGDFAIAEDVTPDLAERAIGRFRSRGTLSASPEVRAVLRRKEADMWKT
jgi:DNA-binding transcriptional ArsR family regulator